MALSVECGEGGDDLFEGCECIAFCQAFLGACEQEVMERFGPSWGGFGCFVKDAQVAFGVVKDIVRGEDIGMV